MKYAFKVLGEMIHNYFGLNGDYIASMDTEVISSDGVNYRMDISYRRTGKIINNIEIQSSPVTKSKIKSIGEYIKYIINTNDETLANAIVITNVDPKKSEKEVELTETIVIRIKYIYLPPEEILKKLNKISDKINSNQSLSENETIELAILPVLAQDLISEKVSKQTCYLLSKCQKIDERLKNKIAFVNYIMLHRNVENKQEREKLIGMINMEERKTALQSLIEEETREQNSVIIQLSEDNENLTNKNENLTNENENLTNKNENLTNENENLTNKNENLTNENEELQTKHKKIKNDIKDLINKPNENITKNDLINILLTNP